MRRKWTFFPLERTFSARSVLIQSMGCRFLKDIVSPEALAWLLEGLISKHLVQDLTWSFMSFLIEGQM